MLDKGVKNAAAVAQILKEVLPEATAEDDLDEAGDEEPSGT
jgi:hypothetical protein